MTTIIAIIVADVLVFLFYVYHYRQELGLTVNGSHDLPVVRKTPAAQPPVPTGPPGGPPTSGRQVMARR